MYLYAGFNALCISTSQPLGHTENKGRWSHSQCIKIFIEILVQYKQRNPRIKIEAINKQT